MFFSCRILNVCHRKMTIGSTQDPSSDIGYIEDSIFTACKSLVILWVLFSWWLKGWCHSTLWPFLLPSWALSKKRRQTVTDRDRPWQTVTPCKFERKKPNIVGKCPDRPWQTVTDRDSKLFPAAHRYGSPGKTCKMKICSLEMCFVSTSVLPRTNPLASAVNFRWSNIKQPTLTCPGHAFQVIHLLIQNYELDCSLWTHKWFRTSSD